jgi:hypothetical protein
MARYVGIEVTEAQVKGVALRAAYRRVQIEAIERVPRGPGPEGLAAALAEVARRIGPGVDATYAALPGTDVSLRMIELPRAVARRGGRMISTELEGSLPYEIDQATIDAQVIRTGETVELLVAAARTERVRALIETLREARIEPREVAVGPIALGELAVTIPELAVAGPVLLLHAYEAFADVAVLKSGVVQLARTLSGQTTPEARARGVRQTLGAYLAGGGEAPQSAYLCGEWAAYYMDVVADTLGLQPGAISPTLPLTGVTLAPGVPPGETQLAPLAMALAMRGIGRAAGRIDLRKGDLALSRGTQVLREKALVLGLAAFSVVASWGFATYTRYTELRSERERLSQVLARVTLDTFGQRVTDPARARSMARGGGAETETNPVPAADALDVIGVLSARIPESIHHDVTQLDVTDERVQLQGLVDSLAERDQIVDAIDDFQCFQNIQRGRTQRNPGDNRQQYALEFELRCPDPNAPAPAARSTARPAGAAPAAPGTGTGTGGTTGTSGTGGQRGSGT